MPIITTVICDMCKRDIGSWSGSLKDSHNDKLLCQECTNILFQYIEHYERRPPL